MAAAPDLAVLFPRAIAGFDARVHAVKPDQWHAPTPDDEWDVTDLVNHLVVEQLWVPETMAGKTMEEVGDRFEGDQVGNDPAGAWGRASAASLAAAAEPGALDRPVHLSRGQAPAREYVAELTMDATVHSWDLARGVGADDTLDPELVTFSYELLLPMKDDLVKSGLFKPVVDVPDDADLQTKLLAIVGRKA
jgi:uncharacterized protein (TIGR03086 family)